MNKTSRSAKLNSRVNVVHSQSLVSLHGRICECSDCMHVAKIPTYPVMCPFPLFVDYEISNNQRYTHGQTDDMPV